MSAAATSVDSTWVGIVDDDSSIRRALVRVFRAHGFEARTFSSGEEYLSHIGLDKPSCLVVDVRLGGMTGFELLDRLCADGAPPPIIFIAAMDEIPPSLLARMSGRLGFLRKPFGTDALIALVRDYCATPQYDAAW